MQPVTDDPCTALEAVDRAMRMFQQCEYQLGAGDYDRRTDATPQRAFDCCGFAISYAWKIRRHRPGYNRHTRASELLPHGATVVDDVNVDSFYEDAAYGVQELGVALLQHEAPRPGDLAITRSIRKGDVLHAPAFSEMGHVRMFTKGPVAWDPNHPSYASCTLVQIHGPNGTVGPVVSSGLELDHWNANWPTPRFCVVVVRPHERI